MDCTPLVVESSSILLWALGPPAIRFARLLPTSLLCPFRTELMPAAPIESGARSVASRGWGPPLVAHQRRGQCQSYSEAGHLSRLDLCIQSTEEMKMIAAPNRPGLPGKSQLPGSLATVNPFARSASQPALPSLAEGASNPAIPIPPPKRPVMAEAPRCTEKACVYPAALGGSGKCVQHQRQQCEPALFEMRQPSMLLLDCAKFGLPEDEPEDSRFRDRRRQAKQRESFLEGAA
jgi:hypothetical protein